MASNFKQSIKLYFMFWIVYIPVSLILMKFKPANFIIVMLIGLNIILVYLLFERFSRKKQIVKKQVQKNIQIAPWTNVFQENFGKKVIDLD